jgi:uncharacterized protein (TIGR03435 family)
MIRLPIALAVSALLCSGGFAQAPARAEFEVAAINPAVTGKLAAGATSSSRFVNNRVEIRSYTLKQLVMMAYRVQEYQVTGGPKWFNSDPWDIDAKAPAGVSPNQISDCLQSLLASRYQLALHTETRTLPSYALVPAKNGVKPQSVEAADSGLGWGTGSIRGAASSIADLAETLASVLQHPVLDQSGLSGLFKVNLKFAPIPPDPNYTGDAPSIFDALQQQMGLKLSTTRGPVKVLIIDRAEKPSPN